MLKLTRAFIEMLRSKPRSPGAKEEARIEAEWFDALAESDSDGVFETLDPIPEQRPGREAEGPPSDDGG